MQSGTGGRQIGGDHDRHGDLQELPPRDEQLQQETNKLAGSQGAASVKELFAVHDPEIVRFFLLGTHYRSPIDLSDERIAETGRSLQGFYRLFEAIERITGSSVYELKISTSRETSVEIDEELASFRDRFVEAMDDDFNTAGAVGVLFELRTAVNAFVDDSGLDAAAAPTGAEDRERLVAALTLIRELGGLLGVFHHPHAAAADGDADGLTEELMQLLIDLRAEARVEKNFSMADTIRDRLAEIDITLEDRTDKTLWRRG
jgi:cysteinyl-tRNA synthetase